MFHYFRHEAEFYPTLSRLPLLVRMKLDLTGLTISLKDWLAFSLEERNVLCHFPIDTQEERRVFMVYLDFLCRKYKGAPAALGDAADGSRWGASSPVPQAVAEKSSQTGLPIGPAEWAAWQSYQRYALYKTAISKSEPHAFFEVLNELREAKR
jgi:hypothetical protein